MVGPLEGGAYGKKLNDWRCVPEGLWEPGPSLSLSASWLLLCYPCILHGSGTKEPLATDWESRTMDQNKTFILLSLCAQTSGHWDANLTEQPVL